MIQSLVRTALQQRLVVVVAAERDTRPVDDQKLQGSPRAPEQRGHGKRNLTQPVAP